MQNKIKISAKVIILKFHITVKMNGISLASITFVVISLTAQLEGLKSAPVSAPFLIDDKRHEIDITPIEFKSDKLITVVFLPCGEKGKEHVF